MDGAAMRYPSLLSCLEFFPGLHISRFYIIGALLIQRLVLDTLLSPLNT